MKTNTTQTAIPTDVRVESGYVISTDKVKKQAKRLLKLKEKYPDIKINNLSQSQEIISQIYGWENWHSFEKYLQNIPSESSVKNTSNIQQPEERQVKEVAEKSLQVLGFLDFMEHANKSEARLNAFKFKTTKDKNTVVQFEKNGQENLVSCIKIKGSKVLQVSLIYFDFIISKSSNKTHFDNNNHFLSFFINNERINAKKMQRPIWSSIYDLDFLIEPKLKDLSNWIMDENHYLLIGTKGTNNQSLHNQFVNLIVDELQSAAIEYDLILSEDILKAIEDNKNQKDQGESNKNYPLQSFPWKAGSVLFRTPRGKLMPYQPMSSMQTTWVDLIYAKPGSGKTVLLNTLNLGLCLQDNKLPYLSIIDVGSTSKGLAEILKSSSENSRDKVNYYKFQNKVEHSINPFDTLLGFRFPTKSESMSLVSLLCLMVTDVSSQTSEIGMHGLCVEALYNMYYERSDDVDPNKYNIGLSKVVDEVIQKLGIHIDNKTSWWEVVDALVIAGFLREAKIAQCYASPNLLDAITQIKKLKNFYDIKVTTGEYITDYMVRHLENVIEYNPIFKKPTQAHFDDYKINIMDLEDIAKNYGMISKRSLEIMYIVARHVSAKHLFLKKSCIAEQMNGFEFVSPRRTKLIKLPASCPVEKYKSYYEKKVNDLNSCNKKICFDEYHRVSNNSIIRDQILIDMREGRKWMVGITMSSQDINSFDATMVEFSTGIFIMDGGSAQTIEKTANVFGLSNDAEKIALENRVHGPKRGGGSFLAKFATTQGWYSNVLSLTLCPMELWMFSSASIDMNLRARLIEKLGLQKSLEVLSQRYPNGSCKSEVDRVKNTLGEKFDYNLWISDVVSKIVNEC